MDRTLPVLVALALLPLAVPVADAWLPVCKETEEDVGGYVWLHASLDCQPGVTARVCPPHDAKCVTLGTGLP